MESFHLFAESNNVFVFLRQIKFQAGTILPVSNSPTFDSVAIPLNDLKLAALRWLAIISKQSVLWSCLDGENCSRCRPISLFLYRLKLIIDLISNLFEAYLVIHLQLVHRFSKYLLFGNECSIFFTSHKTYSPHNTDDLCVYIVYWTYFISVQSTQN